MAQSFPHKKAKVPEDTDFLEILAPRLREGAFIGLIATAIYLTMALVSFDAADPGWAYTGANVEVSNLVGPSGAWIADVCLFFFGYFSFLFPLMLAYQAWLIFRDRQSTTEFSWLMFSFRGVGLFLTFMGGTAIATMHFYAFGQSFREGSGGIMGAEIADLMVPALSYVGTTLVLLATFLFGLTAFLDISWLKVMEVTGRRSIQFFEFASDLVEHWMSRRQEQAKVKRSTDHRREVLERHVERSQSKTAPVIEAPAPKKLKKVNVWPARDRVICSRSAPLMVYLHFTC